jgi:CpeT protein
MEDEIQTTSTPNDSLQLAKLYLKLDEVRSALYLEILPLLTYLRGDEADPELADALERAAAEIARHQTEFKLQAVSKLKRRAAMSEKRIKKMKKANALLLIFLVLCAGGFAGPVVLVAQNKSAQKASRAKNGSQVKTMVRWMTGSFDTFQQVDRDEEENAAYRHIRALLHVMPVEITGLGEGTAALYVENAAAETRHKPYRQRVYLLTEAADGKISVEIYKIKNQDAVVNAYKNPQVLKNLTLDGMMKEPGCDMIFERVKADLFRGSGGGQKTCRTTLRGATHTVSNTELTPSMIINLDQGFDDAGAHKWGPPTGTIGHIFIKRALSPVGKTLEKPREKRRIK